MWFLFWKIKSKIANQPFSQFKTLKSGGAGSSVLLQGKGGKLRGKGGAKLYGKVFGDRPPLLEVHAVVRLEAVFFRVKVASFKVKEAPNFTGGCSVIGRRCWRWAGSWSWRTFLEDRCPTSEAPGQGSIFIEDVRPPQYSRHRGCRRRRRREKLDAEMSEKGRAGFLNCVVSAVADGGNVG